MNWGEIEIIFTGGQADIVKNGFDYGQIIQVQGKDHRVIKVDQCRRAGKKRVKIILRKENEI